MIVSKTYRFKLVSTGLFTLFLLVSTISRAGVKDSLLQSLRTPLEDSVRIETLLRLSHGYQKFDFDSSLLFAQMAIDHASRKGYSRQVADGYMRIGNIHSERGKADSARKSFQKALDYYANEKDTLRMSWVLNDMGLMYRYSGNHSQSLECFLKSLDYKKKVDPSPRALATAYQNIGSGYAIMQNFEVAKGYIEDAAEIFRQQGDSGNYYIGVMNLSSIHRDLGQYEESIKLLNKAYQFRLNEGSQNHLGTCLYNLALTSYLNEDTSNAIRYYQEAVDVFQKLGNWRRKMSCHQRLANVYFDVGDYVKSEAEALKGLQLADSVTLPFHEQKLNDVLARTFYETGKYKLAYEYQKRSNEIERKMAEEGHAAKVKEIQEKYDDEAHLRKIAELSINKSDAEHLARRRTIMNYVLWTAIIVVILIALMLYRLYRTKQDSNLVLQEKNQVVEHSLEEKDVLLREIHHRVQNNLQFVSSLLNLQARRVDDQKTLDVLKSCKQRIQSMALIHQKLYQEESLSGISIRNYTRNLVDSLQSSYGINEKLIRTELEIDKLYLDINSAISIGLVMSELITNAFKYAFTDGEEGLLKITLKERDDILELEVWDDGSGLPQDFSLESSDSFGLKLVHSLARKLKAEVAIDTDNGTRVRLSIKEYTKVNYGD